MEPEVIAIDYHDLINNVDLTNQISKAFGNDGLGLLTVKNIPGFVEARKALLPLALEFSRLPEDVKLKYIHKSSSYSFGWSHGMEKLQGKPDLSKGSFYANPQYDKPVDDDEIVRKYISFVHPNIWPTNELPELEIEFKRLGQLIVSVGLLIAKQCDAYVKSCCPDYSDNKIARTIEQSLCCKARLLHYFPQANENIDRETEFSSWCGWHNDHGSLTGLTSAMYLDTDGNEVANVDPQAGLYIRSRNSELKKINIPQDHLAFQIGETAQVYSGGILQATPHAVRGTTAQYVSRETYAVFMEPCWFEDMLQPSSRSVEQVQSNSAAVNLPNGVSTLQSRWNPTQTFSDFTEATLNSYY